MVGVVGHEKTGVIGHEVVADFEPVEGNIILFPSIIDHSVLEYNDDNIRISIAFNFGIKDDTIK